MGRVPVPLAPSGAAAGQGRSAPELDQLVANLRAGAEPRIVDQLVAAAARWRRPVRIQVTGRARAGKSTLLRALALLSAEETAPVDEPGRSDPVLDGDLVVYVLSTAPQPADRRILAGLPAERTIVVLNKADAIGARWAEAVTAAVRYATELRVPVLPVVAELAGHSRAGTPSEADLRTLRRHAGIADATLELSPELFTGTAAGPDVADRRAVLDRWGLYGVTCALTALRHDPRLRPQPLLQVLHAAAGIDPVHALLHGRYERVTDRRGGEFLDDLARIAARAIPRRGDGTARDLIEDYLAGTEAMWLGLRAGLADPGVAHLAAGYPAVHPADADEALARAQRWRAVVSGDLPAPARRAALRVHNGYVRLWEQLSSAGL
jgi:hypothetical protein